MKNRHTGRRRQHEWRTEDIDPDGGELRLGDSQRVIRGEIAFPRGKRTQETKWPSAAAPSMSPRDYAMSALGQKQTFGPA